MDVLHAQVDTARASGLGQAVVGVVLVVGEILLPAADERGGHGLGADVHQLPLVQLVVGQLDVAPVQSVQNILRPGHQQPDDGTLLVGNGLENDLRGGPLQQHGLAPGKQAAHPVELCAGVVQGRDAEEGIVMLDVMVLLLHLRGLGQAAVLM